MRWRWISILGPAVIVAGFYLWARLERDRQLTAGTHPFHEDSFDDPHGGPDDPQAFYLQPPALRPSAAWLPGHPVPRASGNRHLRAV